MDPWREPWTSPFERKDGKFRGVMLSLEQLDSGASLEAPRASALHPGPLLPVVEKSYEHVACIQCIDTSGG
jgi:hypothetical protein